MNPICLKIGNIVIYWYSVILLIAFTLGCIYVLKEAKKQKIPKDKLEDFMFYTIPICLIGARIYYVLFEFNS